jgi:cytochrome c-type biogenesis protein CcmH
MTLFVSLALLMLAIALAFPLLPLLRGRHAPSSDSADLRRLRALEEAHAAGVIDDDEYQVKRQSLAPGAAAVAPPPARRLAVTVALVLALLLPAGAIVLYRINGDPRALDPAQHVAAGAPGHADGIEGAPADMEAAVAGLVAKLEANPDNSSGWALLGRAYQSMGKFAEARDALKRALDLESGNHELTVEYAQALALSGEGRRIAGESRALIEGVLKADPDHQRALWLIGISDYQAGDYTAAIAAWNRLLPALPPESDIAASVRTQIAEAQRLGGSNPAAGAGSTAPPTDTPPAPGPSTPADQGPRLTVSVSLDPALQDRLDPAATLFVYARAENGPPMPLAIQRLPASALPARVTLDDSMGMLPSMKLSMFEKVVIGARISSSGNAQAQSGDLQTLSDGIEVSRTTPIDLVIDSVVP